MAMLWLSLIGTASPLLGKTQEDQLAKHQRAAQQAEAGQDFAAAVQEYEWIVRRVPDSAEVESNLGVALYFNNQHEQAAAACRRAIALKLNLYTPHLFLGLALAQLSHSDKAVLELEKATQINAQDPLAHEWLGYEYMAVGRYEDAITQLETASVVKAEDIDIWYALGRSYLESGKAATRRLVKTYPDGGRTWQLAAEQAKLQDNRSRALHLYQAANKRRPDIEAVRDEIVALGGVPPETVAKEPAPAATEDELYQSVSNFEQRARDAFSRISRIDPDSYRVHEIAADGESAAGNYDDAIRDYTLALQRKPNIPGVHEALCNALTRVAKPHEAIKECEAEIALFPRNSDAYVETARVYLLMDDYDHAGPLLQKAATLGHPPPSINKLLGKLYLHQKQYPDAIKAFNQYLAVEARDSSAYILLAKCYKSVGDAKRMNEAIAVYKKISAEARGSSEAQQALDQSSGDDKAEGSENL